MEKINNKIVFSNDIKRILKGINAYDFKYDYIPNNIIDNIRLDFKNDVSKIFNNDIRIISEDEMLYVNKLIGGEYPHCYSR